ncbi:hypothetical protein SOASR032_13340 [Pragia fontium]|uniref:Uncharacterized protein n=1 Tax=Pragia fontium TaxID=82985 RepID=A0ABQ5LGP5_9GAMM|nr:hypothetical protein [Pragia fontium]GKX62765.1 hypothetical protein SOASR032_13340 [Pragia fontium]
MTKEIVVCGSTVLVKKSVSIYNQIASLDLDLPLSSLIDSLDEDLLQIEFSNGNIVDVGWYPAFDEQGEFVIYIIKDNNWDTPHLRLTANNKTTLITLLSQSILEASRLT